MDLCVIVAGWQSKLFVTPRLSPSWDKRVAVTKASAASTVSSLREKETIPPKVLCCLVPYSMILMRSQPGIVDLVYSLTFY